jgi:hypothetical protein
LWRFLDLGIAVPLLVSLSLKQGIDDDAKNAGPGTESFTGVQNRRAGASEHHNVIRGTHQGPGRAIARAYPRPIRVNCGEWRAWQPFCFGTVWQRFAESSGNHAIIFGLMKGQVHP